MSNKIVEKYKEDILESFIEVCEEEGYSVDRDKLDFTSVLDTVLSGCVGNMSECLDDEINNQLLGLIDGVDEDF